jgi:hypothetical protein
MQFQGRTLDEIDEMDLLRYLRAMEARKIDTLEETAHQVQTGKKKGSDVSKEEWEEIREHQKIWETFLDSKRSNGS